MANGPDPDAFAHRFLGGIVVDGTAAPITALDLVECGALVHGDMVRFVTLDLVLRVIFRAATRVALVLGIASVDLDYFSADMASF
jgi:hypothetical protein